MTDKATVTITSPRTGRIVETRGAVGGIVPVHSVLVVFDLGSPAAAAPTHVAHVDPPVHGPAHVPASDPMPAKTSDGPAATAVGDIKEDLPGMSLMMGSSSAPAVAVAPRETASAPRAPQANDYFNAKPLATPATRKLARDMEVDLRAVPPTGPQGRVTRVDVEAFAKAPPKVGATLSAPPPAKGVPLAAQARDAVKITAPTPAQTALEERVPFAGVRRKIAQKMAQSVHTAAHFTFVEECDCTALKALRKRLQPAAQTQGVKLTFLPFIVKAVVAALKKKPILNSALDESTNELVYRKYYNIGIAASTEAGLIVPVVKDADRRSVLDVAREIERVATDAKNGKSRMEDLQGSTFTITSLGADGGLFATPIINFPEVGILGVHQIKQKPVVKDGQIVIGDVMLLSLSFDHRIVDGHVGAAFAYDIIHYLEDPDRLFLEMV
jgi:pyruvate dehydrogenase E2 component (dihydrolipoamide acetyltransferase)